MADYIRPTPRNPFLGGLADLLEASTSPERTQQMQGIMSMLGVPAVASTLNRMSYGAPLTSGAGGLGGTTRVLPDVLDAALAVAPMAPAAGKAAVATGKALGPTAAGMTERYMQRQGLMPSLDVYHGTPHTLPPTARNPLGEFDASKIGTGEGAQMYGQGIYTAEAPAVAKEYQKTLAPKNYASIVQNGRNDYSVIAKDGSKVVEGVMLGQAHKAKNAFDAEQTGNLYKVDLPDEMIPKMLDWDKPMNKQDASVKKMIAESFPGGYINGRYIDPINSPLTGQAMLDQLAMIANKRNEPGFRSAEAALRQAGIPGIKYLDEGSRAKGEGTRNFVTFPGEEQNLRILERNGLLGTLAP